MRPSAVVLLAVMAWPTTAFAEEAPSTLPVRLEVHAPAGCVDRASFFARLRSHAPRIREAQGDERAPSVRVELVASAPRYVAKLSVVEPDGEVGQRELEGPDCTSVALGMAFVAAVIVDPDSVWGDSSRRPRSTPLAAQPRDATDQRPFRLAAGAAIEVAGGLGPDLGIVPRVVLGFESRAPANGLRVAVSVGRALDRSVATGSGTATLSVTDVLLEPCVGVLRSTVVRLAACGVADLVILHGEGSDTLKPQRADRIGLDLGLALRPAIIASDRFELGLLLGGAGALFRPRFYFAPNVTAYELAAGALVGEFSASVYFL